MILVCCPPLNGSFGNTRRLIPGLRVEKQTEIEETQVPDPLKAVIYRILQEAMNNIAKHSKANLVSISLTRKTDDRIELVIENNGIGFDMESIKKGLGLGSMRERAELSVGSFDIESVRSFVHHGLADCGS